MPDLPDFEFSVGQLVRTVLPEDAGYITGGGDVGLVEPGEVGLVKSQVAMGDFARYYVLLIARATVGYFFPEELEAVDV